LLDLEPPKVLRVIASGRARLSIGFGLKTVAETTYQGDRTPLNV